MMFLINKKNKVNLNEIFSFKVSLKNNLQLVK